MDCHENFVFSRKNKARFHLRNRGNLSYRTLRSYSETSKADSNVSLSFGISRILPLPS